LITLVKSVYLKTNVFVTTVGTVTPPDGKRGEWSPLIYHTFIISFKYLNISFIEKMQNNIACLLSQKRQHNIWCRWIYRFIRYRFIINHLNNIYHANSVFTVFNYLLQYNIVFGYRHFVTEKKINQYFSDEDAYFFSPY